MKYFKEFIHRGLIFAGFGPIVVGIVFMIIWLTSKDLQLNGVQLMIAIVSSYLLAFIQAGATVFNDIEGWSVPKSMLCHLGLLYVAYLGCYLVNSWIPFDWRVILTFTGIFVGGFLVIWFTVFLVAKLTSKGLNKGLNNRT